MPNEVTYLLNSLNSYITCPNCQVTKEIEIILNCGHLICKDCKNKQTNCFTCFTKITATKKQAPSIKFIEELCHEVLKASAGQMVTDPVKSKAKKERNGERKYHVYANEIKWNGQLNTFISLLNSQSPKDNNSLEETYERSNKKIKMSPIKNCFKDTDMKRKTNNDSHGSSSHLFSKKRQKVENKTEKRNRNVTINNSDITSNKTAHDLKIKCYNSGSLNTNKTLGEIVDETEMVQRYLNSAQNYTIENKKKKQLKDIGSTRCNQVNISKSDETVLLNNDSNFDDVNIPSTSHTESRWSKSEIHTIFDNSSKQSEENPEDDELQSDIITDMLNNVSNEIIIVGNKLCAKTGDYVSSLIDGSGEKNYLTDRSLVKPTLNEHSLNKKNPLYERKDRKSGSCNIIVISDSEDEIEDVKKNLVFCSEIPNKNRTGSNLKDINIKNCKVVIDNFLPLKFQSGNSNNFSNSNKKSGKASAVKQRPDSFISPGNSSTKKFMCSGDEKYVTNGDNEQSSILKGFGKPLKQSPKDSADIKNNFEGFTEQDILMQTVKLALFKMNGCKYFNNFSTSSLYTLDGKQILIKDMSQEEGFTESSFREHKSSDHTIEISDSEDERSLVSSSVQTDYETTIVTPSPSTSKIRPVSITKLRGLDKANEKFMQNDILDTKEPLTPFTPVEQESVSSMLSPNSSNQRSTPVSRRQLSFLSPSFERFSECKDNEGIASSSKEMDIGCSSSSSKVKDDWQVLHNRMQYMMPNYTEESLHNELESSGVRPTRLTFTTCGLNCKETALVTKLASMTKSCLTKDFTHDTTHLIIGASGRGTLEYYLAIAYRAFIVTMEWVTLCIALNKILPVTGFIPTEDEGPLKCLEPISPPFVGFYVSSKILPGASNYPIAEITKTLLSLGGARMMADLDGFHNLQDGNFPRFFVFGASSQVTQAIIDKCACLHIVPVQFMWVYESVSAFRPLPIMDYLGTVIHSRTLIRDYKVPEHLACSRYPRLEGEFHPQILDERYQSSSE